MPLINILFMQSQTYFGADSRIHSVIMAHLDRAAFSVHAAVNSGPQDAKMNAYEAVSGIPDVHLRPTNFGTSVHARSRSAVIRDAVTTGIPAFVSLAGLIRYMRKHHIHVVHCTEKPRDAFLGLLLARASGAKCLVHLHVNAEDWISSSVQWAMRHADAIVGVSDFTAASAVKMGYDAAKVHTVLNGLDISAWDYETDGRPIRQEFNIPTEMPVLAIASRLFYWKGHTELIQALALVEKTIPDFRLLIVGEDDPRATPGRGPYSEELKALTAELGLSERVIFTGFRKDMPAIMAAADIFTHPSFEEPFGMVYVEAMAMKKPVITLNMGGSAEVIEHGKSGLLSASKDIEQMAANIITLIQDSDLRRRMGEYGRRRAETYFNPQRMTRDMENVYRKLVGD
jgi:glycosyltransferase involved in cell wall biosynthesis